MALSLAKNQTISLEKTTGNGLTKIRMGLGWDPAQKPKPSGYSAAGQTAMISTWTHHAS